MQITHSIQMRQELKPMIAYLILHASSSQQFYILNWELLELDLTMQLIPAQSH